MSRPEIYPHRTCSGTCNRSAVWARFPLPVQSDKYLKRRESSKSAKILWSLGARRTTRRTPQEGEVHHEVRTSRRWSASGPRFPSSAADSEAASKRASDDLDDNWDLPEGDLPY